jgi:hypothetical protein
MIVINWHFTFLWRFQDTLLTVRVPAMDSLRGGDESESGDSTVVVLFPLRIRVVDLRYSPRHSTRHALVFLVVVLFIALFVAFRLRATLLVMLVRRGTQRTAACG